MGYKRDGQNLNKDKRDSYAMRAIVQTHHHEPS